MAHTRKKERVQYTSPAGQNRPVRRCAWTREARPKDELLRLVLDPSGRVFVDLLGRGPGRGVYISPDRTVIAAALSPKGLDRIFRGRARGLGFAPEADHPSPEQGTEPRDRNHPSDFISRLLLRRAVELVTLARRAGQLEVGTDVVLQGLVKKTSGSVLVLAQDLSSRTAKKVHEHVHEQSVRVRVFGTKDLFGNALGRAPTGVLHCLPGTLADRIAAEGIRLERLNQSNVQNHDQLRGTATKSPEQQNTVAAGSDRTAEAKLEPEIQNWTRTNKAHLVGKRNNHTVDQPGDLREIGQVGATRYSD